MRAQLSRTTQTVYRRSPLEGTAMNITAWRQIITERLNVKYLTFYNQLVVLIAHSNIFILYTLYFEVIVLGPGPRGSYCPRGYLSLGLLSGGGGGGGIVRGLLSSRVFVLGYLSGCYCPHAGKLTQIDSWIQTLLKNYPVKQHNLWRLTIFYKINNGLAPSYLSNRIPQRNEISVNLRSRVDSTPFIVVGLTVLPSS